MDEIANIHAYGAKNIQDIIKYLTRNINGICVSSQEEQHAAHLLKELSDKLQKVSNQDDHHQLKSQISLLKLENQQLKQEQQLDEKRIKYCIEHGVLYANGFLHADLDQEAVINNDYRAALDTLMQQL